MEVKNLFDPAVKQEVVTRINKLTPQTQRMINDLNEANMVDEKHPFFDRLTREQWSKGTWKHLDHHLTQFGV